MTIKKFDEIQKLVESNNKSTRFTKEFVICLIWKESGFDPELKNSKSTATGLMQVQTDAVDTVNKNTPKGVHFEHSEMKDPEKNIQCGTYYLDITETKMFGVDKSYGTGTGYSKSIIACEKCLQSLKPVEHFQGCLHKIHR